MRNALLGLGAVCVALSLPGSAEAFDWDLGPQQIITAGGADIDVGYYSVPSFVHWNEDGKKDLVVGEKNGALGQVRVYLNQGTAAVPSFDAFQYAQSNGSALSVSASGCLGVFPRLVQWDADGKKDLLIGRHDGTVEIYLNQNTNADPLFGGAAKVQVGGSNIDVGDRATSLPIDWDNDNDIDLVVGALDGRVRLYINGSLPGASPTFAAEQLINDGATPLLESDNRSSPAIADVTGDGAKDLVLGTTYGPLHLYENQGTDAAPVCDGYTVVTSEGNPIDHTGSRMRPSLLDWTGDGYMDILVGDYSGQVYLYEGVPEPATLALLTLGALALRRRKPLSK